MNKPFTPASGNDLRRRMIDDMTVRGFSAKTQHDYLASFRVSLLSSVGPRQERRLPWPARARSSPMA